MVRNGIDAFAIVFHRFYIVFQSFFDGAFGLKPVASVGVEPTTFALLARRSNRLS